MKKNKVQEYFLVAIMIFIATSCTSQVQKEEATFEFDHLIIFINDSSIEDTLSNGILTLGDKLSTKHRNQGTYGQYFIFYNSYLEFLYLENSVVARKNEKRFKSKYSERWNLDDDVCPFGFGLALNPFDTTQTTFPLVPYASLDSPKDDYYLMSGFNSDNTQPLIYISTPNNAYTKLDSVSQVDKMFDDVVREDFRNYLTHPSGLKRLTSMIVTIPEGVSGGNVEVLQNIKNIEIERGKNYGITLVFDNELQGKDISIQSTFTLNIKY